MSWTPEKIPAEMKSEQIIAKLRGDGAALFDGLATAIANVEHDDQPGSILRDPWERFVDHVASILALSGKTITDLNMAVNLKRVSK